MESCLNFIFWQLFSFCIISNSVSLLVFIKRSSDHLYQLESFQYYFSDIFCNNECPEVSYFCLEMAVKYIWSLKVI